MALPLSITLNIKGDAIANDYKYTPSMTLFDTSGTIPKELFIPYGARLSKNDILKGGEFADPKNVTDKDLIRLLGNDGTVIRILDYAEARTGDKLVNLNTSKTSGILDDNVKLIIELIFKNGKKMQLQNEIYTIYSHKLKSWKIVSKSSRGKEIIDVFIDVTIIRGKSVGFIQGQRLSCSDKRDAIRESIKDVFGKDLFGDPKKKPVKVAPKRLVRPQISRNVPNRRSSLSNSQIDQEMRGRLNQLLAPYPNRPRVRRGGRKHNTRTSKTTCRKTRKQKTRKQKLENKK